MKFLRVLILFVPIWMAAGIGQADDAIKPVILLTGFEPFGEKKPPNPSWEGISGLNDTEWRGYRVVTHRMPVIWGEPLKQLEQQIEKLQPVAVFSFGQGRASGFEIESKAGNVRGSGRDNAGHRPVEALIVKDGPAEFLSSFECQRVVDGLSRRGYAIRVSDSAGQYLCEEMLYSLEYVRDQHPGLTVAFCHVPPLESKINGKVVDIPCVRQFVLDFLETWDSVSTALTPGQCVTASAIAAACSADDSSPELPAIKALIDGYFKSWSDQRMKSYGDCFAEGAVIQEITRSGEIHPQAKAPFVAGQTAYHKSARHKAIEVPVKTTITLEANLARAVVYWKLTAGPRIQYGYDHFTLIRQGEEWKIANLVFYGIDEPED